MNSIEWFIVIFGSCAIACVLLDILVIKISDYWFDKEVCGCVFTFLASAAEREKTPNGNWHITCPYCHHEIVIKSSELRKHKEKHKNDK